TQPLTALVNAPSAPPRSTPVTARANSDSGRMGGCWTVGPMIGPPASTPSANLTASYAVRRSTPQHRVDDVRAGVRARRAGRGAGGIAHVLLPRRLLLRQMHAG